METKPTTQSPQAEAEPIGVPLDSETPLLPLPLPLPFSLQAHEESKTEPHVRTIAMHHRELLAVRSEFYAVVSCTCGCGETRLIRAESVPLIQGAEIIAEAICNSFNNKAKDSPTYREKAFKLLQEEVQLTPLQMEARKTTAERVRLHRLRRKQAQQLASILQIPVDSTMFKQAETVFLKARAFKTIHEAIASLTMPRVAASLAAIVAKLKEEKEKE